MFSPPPDGIDISAYKAPAAVTPNDGADLPRIKTRGVYIGGAGNLAVVTHEGVTLTFTGLLVGTIYPIQVDRIKATNTTATNIIALY